MRIFHGHALYKGKFGNPACLVIIPIPKGFLWLLVQRGKTTQLSGYKSVWNITRQLALLICLGVYSEV